MNNGVHLFKPHSGATYPHRYGMEPGSSLLLSSYDGPVWLLDIEKQVFEKIFVTCSNNYVYKDLQG